MKKYGKRWNSDLGPPFSDGLIGVEGVNVPLLCDFNWTSLQRTYVMIALFVNSIAMWDHVL